MEKRFILKVQDGEKLFITGDGKREAVEIAGIFQKEGRIFTIGGEVLRDYLPMQFNIEHGGELKLKRAKDDKSAALEITLDQVEYFEPFAYDECSNICMLVILTNHSNRDELGSAILIQYLPELAPDLKIYTAEKASYIDLFTINFLNSAWRISERCKPISSHDYSEGRNIDGR